MPKQIHKFFNDNQLLVWHLTESEDWLLEQIHLTDSEVIKLSSISNLHRRRSFLVIRLLLKELNLAGLNYLENGKPVIDDGYLSISHAGDRIGIYFSRGGEVGIDIEKIHPRINKIKTRFLNDDELNLCNDEDKQLVLCWSSKEAVFKKYGGNTVFFKSQQTVCGISDDENKIEVKIQFKNQQIKEVLNYFFIEDDYVIVHTL